MITEETALLLEQVLGGTARFWLSLEAKYREETVHREENKSPES